MIKKVKPNRLLDQQHLLLSSYPRSRWTSGRHGLRIVKPITLPFHNKADDLSREAKGLG